jgi:hypothetical protein
MLDHSVPTSAACAPHLVADETPAASPNGRVEVAETGGRLPKADSRKQSMSKQWTSDE